MTDSTNDCDNVDPAKCPTCEVKETCSKFLGREPTKEDYIAKFMDMTKCVACHTTCKTDMADELPTAFKRLWRELKVCPFCAWQLDAFLPTPDSIHVTAHLSDFQKDSIFIQKCRGIQMTIMQYAATLKEDKMGTPKLGKTIDYLLCLLNALHDMNKDINAIIKRNVTQVMPVEAFMKMTQNKDAEFYWYVYWLVRAQAQCGGLENNVIPEDVIGKARTIVLQETGKGRRP